MKLYIFAALMVALFGHSTFAQHKENLWDYAEEYYERKEYASATAFYQRLLNSKSFKIPAMQRLVQCYRYTNNTEEALYYAQLLAKKAPSDTNRMLQGILLKETGQYEEAKQAFLMLHDKYPTVLKYAVPLRSCDSSLAWIKAKNRHKITNLSWANSPYSEISPSLSNQNKLVFASNREGIFIKKKDKFSGEAYYDLYETALEGTEGSPILFSAKINSVHHEYAPSFSKTGDSIYFTRSIDRSKASDDTINRVKLYCAFKEPSKNWGDAHIFFLNDSLFSFADPFMDPSGKMFFFASDMKGGYGNSDLYVCFKKDSVWTRPVNLGPVINSSANETYPFYHKGMLYFSSDSQQGMGGYDIFSAIQKRGDWVKITNMKCPINSPYDDFALIISKDGKSGFFSSNRPEGKGKEDLYQIIFSE